MSEASHPAAAARSAREARIESILQAARSAFCEQGYEGTAMASVAARIGVVEGTLYKYFASKRELLLRVLEHWHGEIFGAVAERVAAAGPPEAQLLALVRAHLEAIQADPLLCRLLFREIRAEQDYHGSGLHALNRRYTGILLGVLERGIAEGRFRRDLPAPLLRDLVYGGLEYHSWNFICGRGALDVDRIAEQLRALLMHGIAQPTGT